MRGARRGVIGSLAGVSLAGAGYNGTDPASRSVIDFIYPKKAGRGSSFVHGLVRGALERGKRHDDRTGLNVFRVLQGSQVFGAPERAHRDLLAGLNVDGEGRAAPQEQGALPAIVRVVVDVELWRIRPFAFGAQWYCGLALRPALTGSRRTVTTPCQYQTHAEQVERGPCPGHTSCSRVCGSRPVLVAGDDLDVLTTNLDLSRIRLRTRELRSAESHAHRRQRTGLQDTFELAGGPRWD